MAEKKTSSSARKTSAEKGSVKKGSAKRSSAAKKKSTPRSESATRKTSAPRAESRPATRASKVAALAASELLELTGKAAEGVTGLERTDDGWTVQIEVCEVRRIPDTTDVLALYEVSTDAHGAMQGYRRVRRYARGAADQ